VASQTPLTLKNFSKSYGDVLAVDKVNLEIKQGEVFGFLGPNGAGKTTTIRAILNFIQPTNGSIKVYGLDSIADQIEIKKRVGYLAGDIALYNDMSGQQLLRYLTSLGRKTDWGYVTELSGRFEANLKKKIGDLSKGNKQKIGLIQAFMYHPDLLILDEPTSGLDPLMQQVFYDLVLEMKKEGKSVFVSSHNLTEVQKICDRAAFIREGRLVSVESIAEATKLNVQNFEIIFAKPIPTDAFADLKEVEAEIKDNRGSFHVKGSLTPFLKALAEHEVQVLDQIETSLEDVFMKYYQRGKK
jgi:ABC-2 type transport system ATP-binding protein